MRILALVTDAFGAPGGIAQYNRDLISSLSRNGQSVTVLARRGSAAGVLPSGVTQEVRSGQPPFFAAAAARILAGGGVDAVFCGHIHFALLTAALCRFFGVPFWLQLHGIEAWDPRAPGIRQACERAALVTAVSRYTRARFLSWAHLPPERVRVLPDTIEDRFCPGPVSGPLARRFGIEGKKVILTVGRLQASERYKGHEQVLGAMADVRSRVPEAVYLIVGDGDDRQRLERLAAKSGCGPCTVFAGQVEDADLPEIYRLAHVFVMPSSGEGFGIVYAEAMASGVPAIGTGERGSGDPLERLGRTASGEALAGAIVEALLRQAPPDLCLARAARETFGQDLYSVHVGRLLGTLGRDGR